MNSTQQNNTGAKNSSGDTTAALMEVGAILLCIAIPAVMCMMKDKIRGKHDDEVPPGRIEQIEKAYKIKIDNADIK